MSVNLNARWSFLHVDALKKAGADVSMTLLYMDGSGRNLHMEQSLQDGGH